MSRPAKDCVDGLRASLREVAERQEREQERLLAKFLAEVSGSIYPPTSTGQSGPAAPPDSNGKYEALRGQAALPNSNGKHEVSFTNAEAVNHDKLVDHVEVDAVMPSAVMPSVFLDTEGPAHNAAHMRHTSTHAIKEHESTPAVRKLREAMRIAEAEAKAEQVREASRTSLQRLVGKSWFDAMVGSVIVANISVMALELEYDGRLMKDSVYGSKVEPARVSWIEVSFEISEQLFTFFFAAELALRLGADGFAYLRSFSRAADAFIVVVCSLDSWVFTPSNVEGMSSIVLLRLLRLLRLAKVFRVIRVMRVFHSLRVLVCAIMTSVGALLWSMTLLAVIELSSGLLMARLFHASMLNESISKETRIWLWMRFGTCFRSCLTMFEITMAPGAFIAHRRIFDEVSPIYTLLFIVYVCFVTFAVIRVITAMFLKATLSAHSSEDQDQTHQRELSACLELLNGANGDYSTSRQQGDAENENGESERTPDTSRLSRQRSRTPDLIYKEDIGFLIAQPKMVTWLHDMELSPQQAVWLFHSIDPGDGRVHFSKYVAALLHMKGAAKAADMTIQFHEIRHMATRLEKIEELLGHLVMPGLDLAGNDLTI